MARYRLLIEYNGTGYHGWQIQPGQRTIQEEIEQALKISLRKPVGITGSGRTDTGVHARGQVAHFEVEMPIDIDRLRGSLNGLLGDSIAILSVAKATDTFHARYDAREREYYYQVSTAERALDRHERLFLRPVPDVDLMNRCAPDLLGKHDFSAFCRTGAETKNRVCSVLDAHWEPEDRDCDFRFVIVADRFLHGMVRSIVGTLLEIGRGKRPQNDLPRILRSKDRREAGPAAPAKGLVLHRVVY